ncbi:MAG: cysteine hydrolase [Oceanospirillaceae bacterium]|nr:cysteine hydrolase [Oceanospirillaceae bacterium]
MSNKALVVIDIQRDYFEGGKFVLFNTAAVLENILVAIKHAQAQQLPVILVQHVADESQGPSPFFNADTSGVEIHPDILTLAADAPIVIKTFSDSFEKTELQALLAAQSIDELLICGMMTQNCVTHTAISKAAEQYKVSILADCCTTSDAMTHNIALQGISHRIPLLEGLQAF